MALFHSDNPKEKQHKGVLGTSEDGKNASDLQHSYKTYNEEKRASEIKAVEDSSPKKLIVGAGACGVLAIVGLLTIPVLAIIALLGAGFFGYKALTFKKVCARKIEQINANYDALAVDGEKHIDACLSQWHNIKQHTDRFASAPIRVA